VVGQKIPIILSCIHFSKRKLSYIKKQKIKYKHNMLTPRINTTHKMHRRSLTGGSEESKEAKLPDSERRGHSPQEGPKGT